MEDERLIQMLNELNAVGGPVESHEDWEKRTGDDGFRNRCKIAQEWSVQNSDLCRMHEIAIDDYIAGRHAVLQLGLFNAGFALCAQAVEKLLKCYLLLAGQSLVQVKKYWHNIVDLLGEAHTTSGQQDLKKFGPFCRDLETWYSGRYPGGGNIALMRSSIRSLDSLVCHLEEFMPLPKEVDHLRYGGGEHGHQWFSIFVRLFSAAARQHKLALLQENEYLSQRLTELEQRFKANRLLAILPAATEAEFAQHQRRVAAVERKYIN